LRKQKDTSLTDVLLNEDSVFLIHYLLFTARERYCSYARHERAIEVSSAKQIAKRILASTFSSRGFAFSGGGGVEPLVRRGSFWLTQCQKSQNIYIHPEDLIILQG